MGLKYNVYKVLHLSISENGIITNWELLRQVYEQIEPRGCAGMAEVKSINTLQLLFFTTK